MQSILQDREIGRFVQHTHHQEDNRSKEQPAPLKRRATPITLPLPNLGPDIEQAWDADVEKQLESAASTSSSSSSSSSRIWKAGVAPPSSSSGCSSTTTTTAAASPAESRRGSADSGKTECGYASLSSSSTLKGDGSKEGSPRPSSPSSSSADVEKVTLPQQQPPDSGYASTTSSRPSTRKTSLSSSSSSPSSLPGNTHRFSAPRPDESTERILSHFSPYTASDSSFPPAAAAAAAAAAACTKPCPPTPPASPEQLERRRIIPVHSYGPHDPTNPRNWALARRARSFALVALLSFTQTWAGSADSSYNAAAARALGVGRVAASLNTAMFSLGMGVGSLFVGPLSETVGRNGPYFVAGAGWLAGVAATAGARDLAGQVVARLVVGLCASVTGSVSGSSVHDLFDVRERSVVFPLLALMNTLPSALAPIPGGWICQSARLSYHWADWISLIIGAPAWLLALLFLPETYSPLLQSWKARHLRCVTGDHRYRSGLESGGGLVARLKETLPRPLIFWGREPVIIILGIYTVLLNVLLFVFLSAFEFLFTDTYGFSDGETNTVFLAIGAGTIFSTLLIPIWYVVDSRALRQRQIYDGPGATLPPEVRLWSSMIASPFLSISIFWLAWTNYPSISPWSGIAACFVFGYALISIQVSSFQYIIDSYGPYAASAMGGITLARFTLAAGMNVASRPMFQALGVHWTLTIIGSIAAVLIPAPWIFYKYGAKVRARSKYAVYA